MGDVIQVLDTFSVERRDRHDGKKHTFEICLIYPDYFDRDNTIIKCKNEDKMNELYEEMIVNVMVLAGVDHEDS